MWQGKNCETQARVKELLMNDKPPTPRQREFLLHAYEYFRENGRFPSNFWIGQQLKLNSSGISNLKHDLKEKGYIQENFGIVSFTEKASEYLASLRNDLKVVIPLQIPVLGKVQAGPKKQDEMAVVMLNSIDDAPTITVPYSDINSTIFALQVEGQSMEREHIFDGDYVIVEEFGINEGPKQNEMIVTMYLPPDVEPYEEWNDEWLDGPTVKFYFSTEEGGELVYRLSSLKDIRRNPYTIKTRYIRPVGRVIGVYRTVKS